MTVGILIVICAAPLNALCCVLSAKRLLLMLQHGNYSAAAYFQGIRKNSGLIGRMIICAAAGAALFLISFLLLPDKSGIFLPLCVLPHFIFLFDHTLSVVRIKPKKPLVCTKRVRRLIVTLSALCCVFSPLSFILLPVLVPLAAVINSPLENRINNGFIAAAKKKLASMPGLIKVGITGSYGKTSVKFYLAGMLKTKFRVCVSPGSYNTPLGMARVINDTLKNDDEILIAEMGARRRGDIRFLCGMIQPSVGILTAVGAQHLETFKCLCNVADAKYELIENLYQHNGVKTAVFNCDNETVRALHKKPEPRGVRRISTGTGKENDVYYTAGRAGAEGSRFSLYIGGKKYDCETGLLGAHNISNVCLAAAAAHALGISGDLIAETVRCLKPAEHRLQLIRGAGGVTVIDDAYNSNPAGARAAIDVLSDFPGQRIAVTPGMVELGTAQSDENKAFGAYMAGKVDFCIAIGGNAADIHEGFLSSGGGKDRITTCGSLSAAQEILKTVIRPGDTVLFENDLPDA